MAKEIPERQTDTTLKEIEKELVQANPNLFKGIPELKKRELLQIMAITFKSHSGPLPPPEDLREYNNVIPNGADRIMAMAEKQQNHRIAIEKKVIGRQTIQSQIGQIFALIIGLVAIGGSVYTVVHGHDWGTILGVGGVYGLVQTFIQGKKSQAKNLQDKNN